MLLRAQIHQATAVLAAAEDRAMVDMLRKVSAERARLLKADKADPCAAALAEING